MHAVELPRHNPQILADAMLGMHDEIAGLQILITVQRLGFLKLESIPSQLCFFLK